MECPLSRVGKSEHNFFHFNVLAAFTPELAEKYHMTQLRETYEKLWKEGSAELVKPGDFRETEELRAVKERRKDYFLMLKRSILNARKSPVEEVSKAGKALTFQIWPDRNAQRESYLNSTGLMTKIVDLLRDEENFPHVVTLGLTETLDALEETNERFNALHTKRTEEAMRRAAVVKTSVNRSQTDTAFRRVTMTLEALYTANELTAQDPTVREEVGRLINAIGALALRLKKTLHIRLARAKGKAGDENEEEAVPEFS